MVGIRCYGKLFPLESPPEFEDILRSKGWSVETSSERNESVELGFRVSAAEQYHDLYYGEELIGRQQPLALLCEMVLPRMHLSVCHTCDYTFLRADVVLGQDGAPVLISGGSFTGKSRLARSLAAADGSIWSEYLAALDDRGNVLPYPRAAQPEEGLTPRAIVNVKYVPGGSWAVNSVSPGQAAINLLPLVAGPADSMTKALPRLAAACQSAKVRLIGERGSVEQALDGLAVAGAWG